METVLITGGSGLIGTRLTQLLQANDYKVTHLSRPSSSTNDLTTFSWDIAKGYIEEEAIKTADHIVHLAGLSLFSQRWNNKIKEEIHRSRVDGAELIRSYLQKTDHHVKTFVSSGGVGYYGDGGERELEENMEAGDDWISRLCIDWERAARDMEELGIRVVINRVGIVFSKDSLSLKLMGFSMNFGIGGLVGNGQMYFPWIHLDDLCDLLFQEIKTEMTGVYNAVAPDQITYREFLKA
ncbi:MAG: TIGR01777 family protein, partial [Bacteroidetes bacterium]|nr:TIGR01777 family protein [Bacteroidota bacterium]